MSGLFSRETRRAIALQPGELRVVLWAAAYFFFLLAGYSILRPLREQMGVAGGVRNLPWLFLGTLGAMLALNPLYGALVARMPRQRFIPLAYRFFLGQLLVFFVLLVALPTASQVWVGRVFFVWVSVFNLFVVSIFWSYLADNFAGERAKRLYAWIAVGGTLGSLAGSGITWGGLRLVQGLGLGGRSGDDLLPGLLLLSALLLEVSVHCMQRLDRAFEGPGARLSVAGGHAAERVGGSAWEGLAQVVRSPYLLRICAYLLLYTVTGSLLYFIQASVVEAHFDSRAQQTEAFALIDVAVQGLTLLVQLFVTARLIAALGLGPTLAVLPITAGLGFLALTLWPLFGVLVAAQAVRRSARYALSKPAREVLFSALPRSEKYKAKAVIDTFVYRSGDALGAGAYGLLEHTGRTLVAAGWIGLPLSAVWVGLGLALGRDHAARVQGDGGPNPGYIPARADGKPGPRR